MNPVVIDHDLQTRTVMKLPVKAIALSGLILVFPSCANLGDALVDSMFDSIGDSIFKSSRDKKIDSDTRRMQAGEPLQHYSSEKRLRVARDDRMLARLKNMND